VPAQRLFFAHTIDGDLLDCFQGHYDTTIGSKLQSESYRRIAADMNRSADEIIFVSDSLPELAAARAAQMSTRLCCRPGNPPVTDDQGHRRITSLAQLE
jgi:enolase-phosphatase E1